MILCSHTYVATPPGETVKELMEVKSISLEDLMKQTEFSGPYVCRLFSGELELTKDIAARLEKTVGMDSEFWMNLEKIYRRKKELVLAENAGRRSEMKKHSVKSPV